MRLRRIKITNFRSLRNVDIAVNKNPLVILGENNVGKSNLLFALRLLLGHDSQRLQLDLTQDDINKVAKANSDNFFTVEVEIGDLQKHPDVEVCFKERIGTDGAEHFIRVEGTYRENPDGDYIWERFLMPPNGRSNDPLVLSKRMSDAIPLYFLDAVRDGEREMRATGNGILSQLLREVEYSDVSENVLEKLGEANAALSESKQIREISNQLTRQLTSFVPGGQGDLTIVVADEDMSLLSRNFRLRIRKHLNEPHASLAQQGTGLQNLTLISLFRYQIQRKQADTWKKTPILTIEEPESHLHPHAQRRLYKDLSDIDAPVIITTHSPSLAKYAHPASLVILRSQSPYEVSSYQLTPNFPDENQKHLSRLIRVDGAESFFARVIIAVEGDSELIALSAFADYLGIDLARDGISVINVGSFTSFENILKAFSQGQLSIPFIVIYDQDVLKADDPSKDQGPKLLDQAHSLGLIDKAQLDSCRKYSPTIFNDRANMLCPEIGWFGAELCFEDEICHHYYDVVMGAIREEGDEKKLHTFLSQKGLTLNADSLSLFVQSRNTLKIPVAHAVANSVDSVGAVPPCYKNALRHAVLLSLGGIQVDEFFEIRACEAGFKDVLSMVIKTEGLESEFATLSTAHPSLSESQLFNLFFSQDEKGETLRDTARLAISHEIESVGCKDFAIILRNTKFPEQGDQNGIE